MKKGTKEFWKHLLVAAVTLSFCFMLFDLWDPMKQMITGHFEPGTKLISYISLKKDIPVIVAMSVVLAGASIRRKKTVKN